MNVKHIKMCSQIKLHHQYFLKCLVKHLQTIFKKKMSSFIYLSLNIIFTGNSVLSTKTHCPKEFISALHNFIFLSFSIPNLRF